jgi:chromate transporter
MKPSVWWQLLAAFAPLSLLSIGGGQTILGDLQKEVVVNHHWLTQAQFMEDFAISRASAGPNSVIVTLIGWQVAGPVGAAVATLAIYLPAALLFFALTLLWRMGPTRQWQERLGRGLAPLAIGLSLGGAYSVLAANGRDPLAWAVAGGALLVMLVSKVNPFVLLLGGAAVFAAKGWLLP